MDLTDALFADAEQVADLAEAVCAAAGQAEAEIENFALTRTQVIHEELERFLAFVVLVECEGLRVGHGFGQLEVAVVVEHGVEADWRPCCRLQVVEVLEAAAGPLCQFLRARQVFAAVRQGFGFLLEQAEFLEVVGGKADEVALACDRDLQRLTDPPSGVGRQACAMADVEAVDGLHKAADGFLEQVGVGQAMVPEPFGDVCRQSDVRRCEPVFEMHIAVAESADGDGFAAVFRAVFTDELRHGPGFEGGFTGA